MYRSYTLATLFSITPLNFMPIQTHIIREHRLYYNTANNIQAQCLLLRLQMQDFDCQYDKKKNNVCSYVTSCYALWWHTSVSNSAISSSTWLGTVMLLPMYQICSILHPILSPQPINLQYYAVWTTDKGIRNTYT